MKTKFLLLVIALSFFSNVNAQSYNDLWKDVNENLSLYIEMIDSTRQVDFILSNLKKHQDDIGNLISTSFKFYEISKENHPSEEFVENFVRFSTHKDSNFYNYDEIIYISKNISMLGLYLSFLELNGIFILTSFHIKNGSVIIFFNNIKKVQALF